MDFLEDLFDFGDRKNRRKGGFFQSEDHHGHHDEDHYDENEHHRHSSSNAYQNVPSNPVNFQLGVVCRKCSTQNVQGAKFCHGCGVAIDTAQNCVSCGSMMPTNATFCPRCGSKVG